MIIPDKIKKEYRLKIESLLGLSFDKSLFIDEQLLKDICKISSEIRYEIALVIDRKGRVIDVIVGDKTSAALSIDKIENRLSQVRVVHTHPSGNSILSSMDISFLKNNRIYGLISLFLIGLLVVEKLFNILKNFNRFKFHNVFLGIRGDFNTLCIYAFR